MRRRVLCNAKRSDGDDRNIVLEVSQPSFPGARGRHRGHQLKSSPECDVERGDAFEKKVKTIVPPQMPR